MIYISPLPSLPPLVDHLLNHTWKEKIKKSSSYFSSTAPKSRLSSAERKFELSPTAPKFELSSTAPARKLVGVFAIIGSLKSLATAGAMAMNIILGFTTRY